MKKTALLLDDDRDTVELNTLLLESAGVEVWACLSAEAALETIGTRGAPDYLFFDYCMPEMNGREFLTRARRCCPALERSRVVVMTGHPLDSDEVAALRGDVDDVFVKPIDVGAFSKFVRRHAAAPAAS